MALLMECQAGYEIGNRICAHFFSHQSLSVEEGWLSSPWSSLGLVLVGLPGLGRLVGLHGLGDLHGLHGAGTSLLHGLHGFHGLVGIW